MRYPLVEAVTGSLTVSGGSSSEESTTQKGKKRLLTSSQAHCLPQAPLTRKPLCPDTNDHLTCRSVFNVYSGDRLYRQDCLAA